MWKELRHEAILFLIVVFTLLIIAGAVVYVHNIVRFQSGLDSTETLRRMWSKSEQILFQPVWCAGLLSTLSGVGISYCVARLLRTALQVADLLRGPDPVADFAIQTGGYAIGAAATVFQYVLGGGTAQIPALAGSLAGFAAMALFGFASAGPDAPPLVPVVLKAAVVTVLVAAVMVWSRRYVSLSSLVVTSSGSMPRTVPWWPIPALLLVRGVNAAVLVYTALPEDHPAVRHHYMARVAARFSDLMVLVACALLSILLVNRMVMANAYRWQWPSMMPAVILSLMEVGLTAGKLTTGHLRPLAAWFLCFSNILMYGATGLISAWAYLGIVAKYAHKALDPGVDGQTELLDEDDDSEFEV